MEESWDFKNDRIYRETAGGPADGAVYGSRGIWRGFGNASGSSGSRDHQPGHSDYYGCFAANSFSCPSLSGHPGRPSSGARRLLRPVSSAG